MGRSGFGGRLSVAAATGLLTLCLAGGPLFVSSAASAALQERLGRSCPADTGLVAHIAVDDPRIAAFLAERVPQIPHVSTRIDTYDSYRVDFERVEGGDGLVRSLRLMFRTGQADHLDGPAATLRPGEILLPAYLVDAMELTPGTVLRIKPRRSGVLLPNQRFEPTPSFAPTEVTVAGSYQPIPIRPEPDYWCSLGDRLLPLPTGDAPVPIAFVGTAAEAVPGDISLQAVEVWVDRDGLSRHDAQEAAVAIDQLVEDLADLVHDDTHEFRVNADVRTGLTSIVTYSESLSDLVRRTVEPVRLAGVIAAVGLLTASAVLFGREQRRELRLRQLRGEALRRTFGRQLRVTALTAAIGGAAGFGGALLAVTRLGPSDLLEPDPVRRAAWWAAAGTVAATVLVAAVVTFVAARAVDAPRVRRRWLRLVPWELAAVALAVGSYLRLDRVGGIRLTGSEAKGSDLLALSFPIVAVLAPVAVLARPTAGLARRRRFAGSRLWFPVRLGWRRVAHEAWPSTILAGAVAIAAGTFVIAGTLTESAEAMLHDKAAAYLGTDLVLSVRPGTSVPAAVPAELADRATVLRRTQATVAGTPVDLFGVDPATFARAVRYRSDGAAEPLTDLVTRLGPADRSGAWPALVAGIGPGTEVQLKSRATVTLAPVAEARWLPSSQTGTGQVVLDVASFDALPIPANTYVWVRDPPAGVTQTLERAGFSIRGTQETGDVFEVTSFLAVSWSYDAFAGLGLLVALVTLMAEVVVLQARRVSRQTAAVITGPMGVAPRHHAAALLVEIAVPMVAGAVVGVTAAILAARSCVRRLDTLRHLRPPAVAHVDGAAMALAGLALLVALAGLVALGLAAVRRARAMEVMRGTA